MQRQNIDPKGIEGLLNVVSKKLGVAPEKLKKELEEGIEKFILKFEEVTGVKNELTLDDLKTKKREEIEKLAHIICEKSYHDKEKELQM